MSKSNSDKPFTEAEVRRAREEVLKELPEVAGTPAPVEPAPPPSDPDLEMPDPNLNDADIQKILASESGLRFTLGKHMEAFKVRLDRIKAIKDEHAKVLVGKDAEIATLKARVAELERPASIGKSRMLGGPVIITRETEAPEAAPEPAEATV